MKKHITFVSQNIESSELYDIISRHDYDVTKVELFSDLYSLLLDKSYDTDMIILDIKSLYDQSEVNCFCLMETLGTLVKTFHTDKNIIVAVCVSVNTDPYKIKEIYGTNINGFIPYGHGVSDSEKSDAISDLLDGNRHTPKKLKFLMENTRRYAKIISEDLTFRQKQIYTLIHENGYCNKNIARSLNISESTVKAHIGRVLKKYGLTNRTQLALIRM